MKARAMVKIDRDALGFDRNRRVSGIERAMSGRSTSILQPASVLWAGSRQPIAHCHARATGLVDEHDVTGLHFPLHRLAARKCRAVARGNGLAEFGGGDYDCCRALLGGIFQLRPQFVREVIG
jgi:hypothetical protein